MLVGEKLHMAEIVKQRKSPFDEIDTVYICGDHDGRSCNIPDELTAMSGCRSCLYRTGTIGKNCIKPGAEIHIGGGESITKP